MVWGYIPSILALWMQKQADLFETEGSLVYTEIPTGATEILSQKNKNKKIKKGESNKIMLTGKLGETIDTKLLI